METIVPVCALCGERRKDAILVARASDDRFGCTDEVYSVLKCPVCKFAYLDKHIADDRLSLWYSEIYSAGGEPESSVAKRGRIYSLLRRAYRMVGGQLSPLYRDVEGRGRTVLDIGCGSGYFLDLFRERGWKTHGVEASAAAADSCRRNGHSVFRGDVTGAGYPDSFFDMIVIADVIEHVSDANALLAEAHRVLKRGGALYVSTPNLCGIWGGVFGSSWINWHLPFHRYFFGKESLRAVLERHRFRIGSLRTTTPPEYVTMSLILFIRKRIFGIPSPKVVHFRTGGRARSVLNGKLTNLLFSPFLRAVDYVTSAGDVIEASAVKE